MRVPVSTYRLQITSEFTLFHAAQRLGYLRDLGADWVYLSPILTAETGSTHGYDVADHATIDPARGGEEGLRALATEAERLGMGVLVDIVPNHVGVADASQNAWWWDVLQHGQESSYAGAFDIDWVAGGGRVKIPVVGDDDLEADGTLRHLELVDGELRYHDNRYPVAPGTIEPGDDANTILRRQHYDLVSWREADHGLNYRRFFAVNTLAAVRVEEPEWFQRSHAEILRWVDEGLVHGIRVDHPDGLRDPGGYLADLAEATGGAYVLVEKILEPGEELPDWKTAGTTGYDALVLFDRVLTDPHGQPALDALESRLRGAPVDWASMVHDRKRDVADGILGSEIRRIVREMQAEGVAGDTEALVDATAEVVACFPVYRSYLPEGRAHLDEALALARVRRPDLLDVLATVGDHLADPTHPSALRFQQTSGMVMAKGVEDCSFYRWSRLTSLNEVGGDPSVFSVTPAEFHTAMAHRQEHWPHAMTATSTHDTKRGEDVRARIAVLAELPDVWATALDRLLEIVPLPDPGFGSLLWQAILGAWPASRERLHGYAEKAMREAGDHTQWTAPDTDYEKAVHAAVDAAFDDQEVREVLDGLLAHVVDPGWTNALSLKMLALAGPGVPDVYQGSELWEQSLVDPDNRRPVDFDQRRDLLRDVVAGAPVAAPRGLDDLGAAKLLVTHKVLTTRREHPQLFTAYRPLPVHGSAADHLLAVDRGGALMLATRLPVGLAGAGGWGETEVELPSGGFVDLLTGRTARGRSRVADLLADLPVALLVPDTHVAARSTVSRETTAPPVRGRFDIWAPQPESITLSVGDEVVPMRRGDDDWWTPDGPVPEGEVDYGYLVDGAENPVADPRSRRQPHGVHGRSRTFDAASYSWGDGAWTGRQLAGSVIYELHIGTFTPEGTFDAAVSRLPHLKEIGVDFVEVMPVNAFNGTHNWGYDGVLWSAVHEQYGGPEGYLRFVDACHAAGIGVIQDVVHNHLGPSGNYLPLFGPYLSTEGRSTWGDHVNLDGEGSHEVRAYILESVRMWLEEYHVDGLRLDAVHALVDHSDTHLLEEISRLADELSAQQRRPLTIIAESDLNDTRLVTPREGGGYGLTAQWSDDFHHAVHVALTGEVSGYYADFAPLRALAKVCESGFFHDGTWSSFRGRNHGAPVDVDAMPAWRLVVCNQNHDQIGNRARGDRLTEHLDDDQLAVAALLTLAGPFTPMLFQGEEWAASTPFQFFTSHPEEELGRIVSEGRVQEFERMDWDVSVVPDPQDPATFQRSKLDWDEPCEGRHARLLQVYRDLAALRRTTPQLTDPDLRRTTCEVDESARTFVMRRGGRGGEVVVAVNFSEEPQTLEVSAGLELAWTTPTPAELAPSSSPAGASTVSLPPHAAALLTPVHRA